MCYLVIYFKQNDTWHCVMMSVSYSFWFWLPFSNKSCVKSYQSLVIIASTWPVRLSVRHIWWFYCCDTKPALSPPLLASSSTTDLLQTDQLWGQSGSLWSPVLCCAALAFDTDKMDEPQTLSTGSPVPVLYNPQNSRVWSLG